MNQPTGYCFWCGMDLFGEDCSFCRRYQPAAWGSKGASSPDANFLEQVIPWSVIIGIIYTIAAFILTTWYL